VISQTVSNLSECLQVIITRLGDLVGMFIKSEKLVLSDAKESDRGIQLNQQH